jgi:hypothetical protein
MIESVNLFSDLSGFANDTAEGRRQKAENRGLDFFFPQSFFDVRRHSSGLKFPAILF